MRLFGGNSENPGVRAETNGHPQAHTREATLGEEPRIKQTKQGRLAVQVSRLQKAPSTKHTTFHSKPKHGRSGNPCTSLRAIVQTESSLLIPKMSVCSTNRQSQPVHLLLGNTSSKSSSPPEVCSDCTSRFN